MIYIIDNGESYSDHSIYFVDVPDKFVALDKDRELVEKLLCLGAGEGAHVIAKAPTLEWYEGKPCALHSLIKWPAFIETFDAGEGSKRNVRWVLEYYLWKDQPKRMAWLDPREGRPRISDELAQYLLDGWRASLIPPYEGSMSTNDFQTKIFLLFEEMLEKGELR